MKACPAKPCVHTLNLINYLAGKADVIQANKF